MPARTYRGEKKLLCAKCISGLGDLNRLTILFFLGFASLKLSLLGDLHAPNNIIVQPINRKTHNN